MYLVVVAILPGCHLLSQSLQTIPHLNTKTHQALKRCVLCRTTGIPLTQLNVVLKETQSAFHQ